MSTKIILSFYHLSEQLLWFDCLLSIFMCICAFLHNFLYFQIFSCCPLFVILSSESFLLYEVYIPWISLIAPRVVRY